LRPEAISGFEVPEPDLNSEQLTSQTKKIKTNTLITYDT